METFHLLVDAIIAAVVSFLIWDLVHAYKASVGTAWQRIVAAAKGAARSGWTGFTVMATAVVGALAELADLVNAPTVATALQQYGQPKYVAAVMIAAAVVIETARRWKS